jgi:diguanylate cyclase (GGDEF)-like protein
MRVLESTDFGEAYAAEYDAAASRDLPSIALLGSILFLAFAIADVATHPGDHTQVRVLSSVLPAAALGLLAYVARSHLAPRHAPWGVVVGGLVAISGPLITTEATRHTIDLAYAMLIMAAAGAVVYRQRAFWLFTVIAAPAYLATAFASPVSRDTRGDWIAAGAMAIGLGAALFTARRFTVREVADANERLAYLAGHDPLTGLLNRHALETSGPGLIALARRERRDVFAVFVDVDALSTINNAHGHGAGDAVIRAVGAALLATVRAADIVARWGGDEMVIVGIGDGPEAERVEAAVRAHALERTEVPGWDGQVSVGIAALRSDAADLDALILAADAAMYERRGSRRDGAA